jgi:hypothetical protein
VTGGGSGVSRSAQDYPRLEVGSERRAPRRCRVTRGGCVGCPRSAGADPSAVRRAAPFPTWTASATRTAGSPRANGLLTGRLARANTGRHRRRGRTGETPANPARAELAVMGHHSAQRTSSSNANPEPWGCALGFYPNFLSLCAGEACPARKGGGIGCIPFLRRVAGAPSRPVTTVPGPVAGRNGRACFHSLTASPSVQAPSCS